MDMHVEELVETLKDLLKHNDIETARYLQNDFINVWNAQAPNSRERKAMAAVLAKWH